ncbi:hypothetical protein KYR89_004303 [Salmonella enterica]|nr:hypothetical protein [Salmonella enterica]EIV2878233.1 hypothetical protein [Salmonella enterica]
MKKRGATTITEPETGLKQELNRDETGVVSGKPPKFCGAVDESGDAAADKVFRSIVSASDT